MLNYCPIDSDSTEYIVLLIPDATIKEFILSSEGDLTRIQ